MSLFRKALVSESLKNKHKVHLQVEQLDERLVPAVTLSTNMLSQPSHAMAPLQARANTVTTAGVVQDDIYEDNNAMNRATAVTSTTLTNLVLLDADWYRWAAPARSGAVSYQFSVHVTSGGDQNVTVRLYNQIGGFMRAGSLSATTNVATVNFATASTSVPTNFYFQVTGTPGVSYSYYVTLTISNG